MATDCLTPSIILFEGQMEALTNSQILFDAEKMWS